MKKLKKPESSGLKKQLDELGVRFGSERDLLCRLENGQSFSEQRFRFVAQSSDKAVLRAVEIKRTPVRGFHFGDVSSSIDMREGDWFLLSKKGSQLYAGEERAMLECAAKAAGYRWRSFGGDGKAYLEVDPHPPAGVIALFHPFEWSPLDCDAQAFRLSVATGLSITPYPIYNESERHSVCVKQRRRSDTLRERNPTDVLEVYKGDPLAATRLAIVKSAALAGGWKGSEA